MNIKLLPSLSFFAFGLFSSLFAQTQLWSPITGPLGADRAGNAVALSSNGLRVAVGYPSGTTGTTSAGFVRVFQFTLGGWVQMGNTMIGEAALDFSGIAVAMSNNGLRVAIGAQGNDGAGSSSGHVRVYDWNGSAWVQAGADINGEAGGDQSGGAVSLSGDGNRLAIGARFNDGVASNAGHIRVFQWTGSAWTQMGSDIEGAMANSWLGQDVSLSDDGNRLAASGPQHSGLATAGGYAVAFEWNGSNWVQMGTAIEGTQSVENVGRSVALSGNGLRMAVGVIGHQGSPIVVGRGQVRVYEWSGSSWVALGIGPEGTDYQDLMGREVALSHDGSVLLAGATQSASNPGFARLFQWSGSAWTPIGSTITGSSADAQLGTSVALSDDGSVMAIGSPMDDTNGTDAGAVTLFDNNALLPVEWLEISGRHEALGIAIHWETALELNNAGFQVEHQANESEWEALGFVPGKGNTDSQSSYRYLHLQPEAGRHLYRLRQIDSDGREQVSASIEMTWTGTAWQPSPNPTNGPLNLPEEMAGEALLFDLAGRQLAVPATDTSMDLGNLPPGTYFLQLPGSTQPFRILKQ